LHHAVKAPIFGFGMQEELARHGPDESWYAVSFAERS
jgi:hypothetical protein